MNNILNIYSDDDFVGFLKVYAIGRTKHIILNTIKSG